MELFLSQKNGQIEHPNPNKGLITGTHEDIDMVIAFANTLIFVEAKGDTSWSNRQLNKKVKRLDFIFKEENGFTESIIYKMVLMSPQKSKGLKYDDNNEMWPDFLAGEDNKPFWINLKMTAPDNMEHFLKVVRCNEDKKRGENGGSLKIERPLPKNKP